MKQSTPQLDKFTSVVWGPTSTRTKVGTVVVTNDMRTSISRGTPVVVTLVDCNDNNAKYVTGPSLKQKYHILILTKAFCSFLSVILLP